MNYKYQEQAEIGIERIRNANNLQDRLVGRLHTKNCAESEEEWIKTIHVTADCIQVTLNEMQSALKKLKGAVAKIENPGKEDEHGA